MEGKLSGLCRDFSELLASKAPVPGGGGAAALCGALAASLGSMAARLSSGRKSSEGHESRLEALISESERLRLELLALIDADAEGFIPLSEAYAIPRSEPRRAERLSLASQQACAAPMGMLECCAALTLCLEELYGICSKIMLSDVGCAAALCRAAMEAAVMNVLVNVPAIADSEAAEELKLRCKAYNEEYCGRLSALSAAVTAALENM